MNILAEGLLIFFQVYYFILLGRIIMSFVMMSSGGGMGSGGNKTVASIYRVLYGLTEPLLAPLRSVLPSVRMGMGSLDLSPIVLLILLRMLQQIIIQNIRF